MVRQHTMTCQFVCVFTLLRMDKRGECPMAYLRKPSFENDINNWTFGPAGSGASFVSTSSP